MLNKLLKNDFIATGRIMGVVYAVVAVIMAYVMGSYLFHRNATEASVGQMLGVTAMIIISSCSFILTVVVMFLNFQKTLYGEQGYLSFTLPVKSVFLLTSKVITSAVWFIAAFVCFMGSLAVTAFAIREDVIGDESYEMIETMIPLLLGGKSVSTMVVTAVLTLVSLFIRFAVFTIEVYFAISLANTRRFQKNHVIWSVVFSFVIIAVSEKISEFISDYLGFGFLVDGNSVSFATGSYIPVDGQNFINLTTTIFTLIIGAVIFYFTHYVMSKKVNIR